MTRAAVRRKILLLSSDDRLALSVCRALAKGQNTVSILRLAERKGAADYSRYCAESFFLGAPGAEIGCFQQRLIQFLLTLRPDYLLPLGAMANDIAYFDFSAVADVTRVIGPTPEAYALARNLISAREVARVAGLICPKIQSVTRDRFQQLEPSFPCTVRATLPSGILDNEWQHFSERTVRSAAELEAKLRDDLPRVGVVLHAPLSGESVGLHCCALEGTVLAAGAVLREHRTKRSLWASLQTLPLDSNTEGILKAIARELRWTGFLTANCRLLNGRLTFECLAGGVDEALIAMNFADADFMNAALDGLDGAGSAASVTPEADVRSKHRLLEMLWLWENRRRLGLRSLLRSAGASIVNTVRRREISEVESATDPLPAVRQFDPFITKFSDRIRATILRIADLAPGRKMAAVAINRDARLLIVCHGNINRSVVAEHLFRARGCVNVSSAALLSVSGRCASAEAESYLAQTVGMEISGFRSQSIDRALSRDGEPHTVLCFEHWHAVILKRRFPRLKGKIVLMSKLAVGPDWGRDISDPHGRDERQYRHCFSIIHGLVSAANLLE